MTDQRAQCFELENDSEHLMQPKQKVWDVGHTVRILQRIILRPKLCFGNFPELGAATNVESASK
jgi:hypothetical protein